jgi:hypothetical protein
MRRAGLMTALGRPRRANRNSPEETPVVIRSSTSTRPRPSPPSCSEHYSGKDQTGWNAVKQRPRGHGPRTPSTGRQVTAVTFMGVSTERQAARWVVLVVRIPATPSRHRVAVWRELRRIGAVSLGQGAWVVPDVPVFAGGIARVIELAERGGGEVVVLDATGRWRDRRGPAGGSCSPLSARTSGRSSSATAPSSTPRSTKRSTRASSRWRSWKKRSTAWSGCAAGTTTSRPVTCSVPRPPRMPTSSSALHRAVGRLHRAGVRRAAPDVTAPPNTTSIRA